MKSPLTDHKNFQVFNAKRTKLFGQDCSSPGSFSVRLWGTLRLPVSLLTLLLAECEPKAAKRAKLALGEKARWADISEFGRKRTSMPSNTMTAFEGIADTAREVALFRAGRPL